MKYLAFLTMLAGCGGPPPLTDKERCDQACAALLGCGVFGDAPSCSSSCQMGASVYLACIKALPTTGDCPALAVCAFKQFTADHCGNSNGAVGSGSCNGAQACEGQCTANNAPPSCACPCIAGMSPDKALQLFINNACTGKCPNECGPNGSGAACLFCFGQKCGPENAQCRNN